MKVIVIEDDPTYAHLIELALEGMASQVIVCDSWDKATPYTAGADVLWIDLSTPGVSPSDVPERIARARHADKELVIVVASGFLSNERRTALESAGVDFMDHKTNRVDPQQIAALILLGILHAKRRGAAKADALLDRALDFMHRRFPDAPIQVV